MFASGSCSRPAKPSGSSSSLSLIEAVDDVVDDGMRKSSSWAAVEIVDEVLEAPRRSHKGLVATVCPLTPEGPRAPEVVVSFCQLWLMLQLLLDAVVDAHAAADIQLHSLTRSSLVSFIK